MLGRGLGLAPLLSTVLDDRVEENAKAMAAVKNVYIYVY